MLRATFAALAVASALVLSAPLAASAAVPTAVGCGGVSMPYANSVTVTSDSPTVTPGGTTSVTFSNGYFAPGDAVTVSVAGVNASNVSLQSGSASGLGSVETMSDSAGGLVVSVTFPQSAEGTYTVSGISNSGCGGLDVTVDTAPGSNSVTASTTDAAAADQLAFTGGTLPTILLVTGGGALIFGAILLMIRSRARRHHTE